MTTRLSLVSILVPDYDEAIRFFVEVVGFELREDTPQGDKRWVVVGPHVGGTGIVLAVASDDAQRARIGDQLGGRVGFFLQTDNFERTHARMVAADVIFLEAPRHEVYGTVAVFVDPFGNHWDLLQPAEG